VNLDGLETRGKRRAKANDALLGSGQNSLDTFVYTPEGISIGNPWMSSCGRFEVNPYHHYGRSFVEWLLRGSS